MNDKTMLIRQLVPKSYHFDGYSELNCPNSRDKPLFTDNTIKMGEYDLTTRLKDSNTLSIEFSSTCENGYITFLPYELTISEFAKKIQEATKEERDFITIQITTKYEQFFCEKNCSNKDCSYLKKERPKEIYAAISFEYSDMKEALAMYFEIIKKNGGKSIMAKRKNKFFGVNFEFGISKDPNISSTLMGISVRNPQNGSWYVFDMNTLTRKNVANIKMGDFPVILSPSTQYIVGKLYKVDNEYGFVQSVNPDGTITFVNGATGNIFTKVPEESIIPGMNFKTEVIAFDAKNMMNPASGESVGSNILAAIFMMQWAKGSDKAEFSLDDISDDSFNGLGAYLPLLMASGGMSNLFGGTDGNNNLALLMALGSGDSETDDLTQMMFLNMLLNGNNVNTSNSAIIPNLFPQQQTLPISSTAAPKVTCEKCGSEYDEGTNFCPKCGGKTKSVATTCRKCGVTLLGGAAFCHKCGAKVGDTTCSNCGAKLDAESKFCHKCGTPVDTTPPVVEVEDNTPSTPTS